MKYRIIECIGLNTWFEVEKKHWYGWSAEDETDWVPMILVDIPKRFKTYEEAKQYIMDKKPKTIIEQSVNRRVYETIVLCLLLSLTCLCASGQTKPDTSKYPPTLTLTSTRSNYGFTSPLKPLGFVFFNTPQAVLSISAPDSLGYITIKYSPKLMIRINDTTFKFKNK